MYVHKIKNNSERALKLKAYLHKRFSCAIFTWRGTQIYLGINILSPSLYDRIVCVNELYIMINVPNDVPTHK